MGQKVHPFIQRIGIMRTWQSRWFARAKEFPRFVKEDHQIRKIIKNRFKQAGVSMIIIERLKDKVRIYIFSVKPGVIIGRHGQDIERLKEELNILTQCEVNIEIEEVKNPALDAQLVAENIASQIEKRVAFRRAVKRAMEQSMNAGAKGIRVSSAGRLNGAEMSRTETYKQGKIPLQTLRADIDYGFAEALTTYGLIGIKVWIYKGDVLTGRNTSEMDNPDLAQTTSSSGVLKEK
ncbi:MAG: 30S ribosomal protein S3 [Candidatus Omnitrophica bacterium]|nr:30S ribosomal protein S3 [Candidatus Omnitrophota bacterium]